MCTRLAAAAFIALALASTPGAAQQAPAGSVGPAYRIHPGDEIEIMVWGDARLQRTLRVLPDGTIAFPLAGQITIGGQLPTDIERIITASRAIVQFQADGHPVSYGPPQFLVSNLEEVKMSLIAAAMQNSRLRAGEFAKNGDVKVGPMRSASQGAFYILPASANSDVSDWGGTYDKTTVDKIARVVVTVDYRIDP